MTDNFKLNVGEVLGFEYQNFMSKQKSLAISNPDKFFTDRAKLSQALKVKLSTDLYDSLYGLLIKGSFGTYTMPAKQTPSYPPQKMNDVVISVVSELASALEDVLSPGAFVRNGRKK